MRRTVAQILLLGSLIIDRGVASDWAVEQCKEIIQDVMDKAFFRVTERTKAVREGMEEIERRISETDQRISTLESKVVG